MNRALGTLMACMAFARVLGAADAEYPVELTRLAVGSCHRTGAKSEDAFAAVAALNPQVFLMLGDNIYGDTRDMRVLRDKYAQLGAVASWRRLRAGAMVMPVWDDHDYGENDAGAEYPCKMESAEVFRGFFQIPATHPMSRREGVYHSAGFGGEGRRVQVILLDARSFRSPLKKERVEGRMTYLPDDDPAKTILGEVQWRWLEQLLLEPADVRLIGSGIQVLATQHRFEKWANLPGERKRLLDLVAAATGKVVLLSGDRHMGEIARTEHRGRAVVEMTSSGLTHAGGGRGPAGDEPNALRVGNMTSSLNMGSIRIEWRNGAPPDVVLRLHDLGGGVVNELRW